MLYVVVNVRLIIKYGLIKVSLSKYIYFIFLIIKILSYILYNYIVNLLMKCKRKRGLKILLYGKGMCLVRRVIYIGLEIVIKNKINM